MQAALEAEMTEAIGAEKGERTETRIAYRSGYYTCSLITRVGTLELRVSQNPLDRFSTELFERYLRSEKAFSTINKSLDEALDKFAQRRLGASRLPISFSTRATRGCAKPGSSSARQY